MTTTKHLTEKRAADRKRMADQLQQLVLRLGGTVERSQLTPRCEMLDITGAQGLHVYIDLDGESCQPDVHVIPWHITSPSEAKLAPSFGDVNPHHFRKATHVVYGFAALHAEIERGLSAAKDGSAFQRQHGA
jgi:hypothetical protein